MLTFDDALNQAKSTFSPSSAVDYLKARYSAFRALGPLLVDMEHQASVNSQRARQLGNLELAAQMKQRIYDIGTLASLQQNTLNRIDEVLTLAGVDVSGLGLIPIVPLAAITTAVAVVAVVLFLTFHISAQQQALKLDAQTLELVAAGKITTQQALDILNKAGKVVVEGGGGGIGSQISKGVLAIAGLAALLYLGPVIFPKVKGALRA